MRNPRESHFLSQTQKDNRIKRGRRRRSEPKVRKMLSHHKRQRKLPRRVDWTELKCLRKTVNAEGRIGKQGKPKWKLSNCAW